MAKRFTDTDKWKREWFSELDPKAKLVWFYILDQCDHRGVWFSNFKLLSLQTGFKVSKSQFENWFGHKVQRIDEDKYFIRSFVDFQYGELNESNNAHRQVIALIKSLEKSAPHEDLESPSQGAQDKDKDKDKDKESVLREAKPNFDFDRLYSAYPLKVGKQKGFEKCKAQIKSEDDYAALQSAIIRYAAHVARENKYAKHFDTFMTTWRDWTDPTTGSTLQKVASEQRVAHSMRLLSERSEPEDFERSPERLKSVFAKLGIKSIDDALKGTK